MTDAYHEGSRGLQEIGQKPKGSRHEAIELVVQREAYMGVSTSSDRA